MQVRISTWQEQLVDDAETVLEAKGAKTNKASRGVDALYKKIGPLEVERDLLASRPGIPAHPKQYGR